MADAAHLRMSSDMCLEVLDLLALQHEHGQHKEVEVRCKDGVVCTSRLLMSLSFSSLTKVLESKSDQEDVVLLLPDMEVWEIKKIFRAFLNGRWRVKGVNARTEEKVFQGFTGEICEAGNKTGHDLEENNELYLDDDTGLMRIRCNDTGTETSEKSYSQKNSSTTVNSNNSIISFLKHEVQQGKAFAESNIFVEEIKLVIPIKTEKHEQVDSDSFHSVDANDEKLHVCLCGTAFKQFDDFSRHVKCNHEEDSMEYMHYNEVQERRLPATDGACCYCDAKFSTSLDLDNHKKRYIGNNGRLVCPEEGCEMSFRRDSCGYGNINNGGRTSRQLKKHMMDHSGVPKSFSCSDCKKSFFLENDVRYHYKRVHIASILQCNKCPQKFKNKSNLYTHMFSHSNERPFSCEICGNTFKAKNSFKRHMFFHTNIRSYECQTCNKMFKTSEYLRNHKIHVHEGIREYSCDQCNQKFKREPHFKKHLMLHTGERPFNCSKCQKGFIQKVNRNLHESKCNL